MFFLRKRGETELNTERHGTCSLWGADYELRVKLLCWTAASSVGTGHERGALRCVAPPLVPNYEELSEAVLAALLDRYVAETEIAEKAVNVMMEVLVGELGSSRTLPWSRSSHSLSSV